MDIVERLRQRIGLVKFDSDAIALHDAADEIERLRDEIYNLKLAVAGGEDAPGLANLVGLEDVIMWRKLWTDEIERLRGDVECARECSKVAYSDAEIRDRRIGRLQDALDRIANIDYRGNAHESLYIAREALKGGE